MLADQLFDPNELHLPLDEAIFRITSSYRDATFDRERGDAKIRENYDRMVAGDTPEIILQSQRALFGHTVWVSVCDGHEPCDRIEFLLIDSVDIWIEYRSEAERERLRPSLLKLAELLGYEIASHP